ncbi:hypothetical protein MTR67_013953 [Solanum verrucosum]|uniref:C2 domain-containing protein n=1 Tax=Solanum verrucosum TaxID=315347 RepID=A0AAF0QDI0_SOLVR|nr:hypothetical protein MTR67_013953 [Solanum verrucosum]
MGSRFEVEVKISSAKDLKNVNWRYGRLKPYAVVWVDPKGKCSTKVDDNGDTSPSWNEKLVIPLYAPIEESTLYIDVVHANATEGTKPLIGSAKLPLREVVDSVGIGNLTERSLDLKRPSGRPHGKVKIEVTVRDPRYRAPDPYYAPPYGVPPPAPPQPYGGSYGAPAPAPGYPQQGSYGSQGSYGQQGSYGAQPQGSYGSQKAGYGYEEKKKSKFGGMGLGAGLAMGAVAGALGGLAISEGIDHIEDNIAEKAAEKVEDDLDDGGYDDDDY